MNIKQGLKSKPRIALAAVLVAFLFASCAPPDSEFVGEDRSGLTETVQPRSPVIPGPEDDVPDDLMVSESGGDSNADTGTDSGGGSDADTGG